MIKLKADGMELRVSGRKLLAEGSVNTVFVEIELSPDWRGLNPVAVFGNGDVVVAVPLEDNGCVVPWEVMALPGELFVSLRGVNSADDTVICTNRARLGYVHESLAAKIAAAAENHTPDFFDSLAADIEAVRTGCLPLTGGVLTGNLGVKAVLAAYYLRLVREGDEDGVILMVPGRGGISFANTHSLLGGVYLRNIADPENDDDAATKGYADSVSKPVRYSYVHGTGETDLSFANVLNMYNGGRETEIKVRSGASEFICRLSRVIFGPDNAEEFIFDCLTYSHGNGELWYVSVSVYMNGNIQYREGAVNV